MFFSENIEDYHELWESKRYFLAPINPIYDKTIFWGDVNYIPYYKHATHYTQCLLPPELGSEIIRRMIEAGCEVLDKQPDYEEYENKERLWGDRKHEFIIIKTTHTLRPYRIYHPEYKEWTNFRIDDEAYDLIIKKMIAAGVPVRDDSKC